RPGNLPLGHAVPHSFRRFLAWVKAERILPASSRNHGRNHERRLEPLVPTPILRVAVPQRVAAAFVLVAVDGNLDVYGSMGDHVERGRRPRSPRTRRCCHRPRELQPRLIQLDYPATIPVRLYLGRWGRLRDRLLERVLDARQALSSGVEQRGSTL